jgi:hypothetical protein
LDRAELRLRRYFLAAAGCFSLSFAAFGLVGLGGALEAAEGGIPHGGECGEVALLHFAEGFWVEAVVHFPAVLGGGDEAGVAEDAEVAGDGGAADLREGGGELAGGQYVVAAEEVEDGAPRRIGEGVVDVRLR